MGEILGIGPVMGCIPCVREVMRCGIIGVTSKPVMQMVLCQYIIFRCQQNKIYYIMIKSSEIQ